MWKSRLICFGLILASIGCANGAAFDLGIAQLPIVLVPGFNHANVVLPVTGTASGFDFNALQVSSDSAWVVPQVDIANQRVVLQFTTSALTNSTYTATVSATHGANTDSVFVNATLGVRNLFKLMDDPVRSRMYGIQLNGVNRGAIVIIDPLTGASVSSVTVGNRPTGMAVSNDGSELFVINAADKTVSVVNLETLSVSQTLILPSFDNWGVADTTANIAVGPGSILYYTDGAWAPLLRVYDRSTGLVTQTVSIDGPTSGYGFGDFALNAAKTELLGWAQYGWTAGWLGSYLGKFSVAANGALTFVEKTNSTYPTILNRDPLETPVLINGDGTKAFIKQIIVSPDSISSVERSFSNPVYSITSGGEIAVTTNAIFQTSTGNKLYDLPITTSVHAITSDYSRLVYYNTTTRTITSLDLVAAIGSEVMGRTLSPADGSIVLAPSTLSWVPLPGAGSYRVYLGTSRAAVSGATMASTEYLGSTTLPDIALSGTLAPSVTYYWRVDAQVGSTFNPGTVYSFTVSPIASSLQKLESATVQGHADHRISVSLASANPGESWTASANQSWVSFANTTGVTPSSLEVILNASTLPAGVHLATVTLSGVGGILFTLPVKLTVEPLALTVLKSDRDSSKVYAISENTSGVGAKAYLLEIDSTTESILRVRQVGTSVTDLAIHNGENRLYVPNWMPGSLLALNKTTLALERTYAFTPFGGVGYGANDVYRVSAGSAGRIVVEEQDQWVDLSIFDTSTGVELSTIGLREGGGGFDPTGRFYYHGENNSSGAEIYKLDVTGDVFSSLARARVSSFSYYGSRVVVVSENGSGVFWNGSYFNSNLVEQWKMSAEIYSSTPDARLAFGETKVYDTVSRQEVLAMPVRTRISTYNSASKKLVLQNDGRVRFYSVKLPLSLPEPALIQGAITQTSIALSWTDDSLETGFTLQQRVAGSVSWTNSTSVLGANETTFLVSGLSTDTSYEFRIKADAPTVSSGWSEVLSVRTLPPPPPTATMASATLSNLSVALSFFTTGNPNSIVIERAVASTGPWSVLASLAGTATSYSDSIVEIGTTYYYRIRATRLSVQSDYSNTASVTIPFPSVSLISLSNMMGAVQIFMSSANSPGLIVIERASSDTGPWSVLDTLPGLTTSYLDTSVEFTSTYYYRLKVVSGSYNSAYTEISSITTPMPIAPAAPTGFVVAMVSASQIGLRWNDVALENGYQIDRRLVGEFDWTPLATLSANTSSYEDTSVVTNNTYVYRLSAFNVAGSSTSVQSHPATASSLFVVLRDDFDPELDSMVWAHTSVTSSVNGGNGFNGTKALWFGHSGMRSATTNTVPIVAGARLSFDLRAGNSGTDGSAYWDNSESREGIALEYSLDSESWTTIQAFSTVFPDYKTWQRVTVSVPSGAISSATQFRWRQIAHSGMTLDTWALDNVEIESAVGPSAVIVEQPEPELVMEGDVASFRMRVNRSGLSFQWYKDDVKVPGATQSTYTLSSTRASHAGKYVCRATSPEGVILESDEAILGVIQPVGSNSLFRVRPGGQFSLAMRVFPPSLAQQLSHQWYRLVEGDLSGVGTFTGENTANLRVTGATADAAGSYYCYVSYLGVYGLEVGPYQLAMMNAPVIEFIEDKTFFVGNEVSIPVRVDDSDATVNVSGLPAGLRFDAVTRRIVGIPEIARSSVITVGARNAYGVAVPVAFDMVTSPFPSSFVGQYQGVIQPSEEGIFPHGGHINMQVSQIGSTSLRIQNGAAVQRVSSTVQVQEGGTDGYLRVRVGGITSAQFYLLIVFSPDGGLAAEVVDSEENPVAEAGLAKNVWTKSAPSPETGLYNTALSPEMENTFPEYPSGFGFVTLTNSAAGTVGWAGRLSDGTVVSGSSLMSGQGDIPLYRSLYSGRGSVVGWVQCVDGSTMGSLVWAKDDHGSKADTRLYKAGIPAHQLGVSGGRYVRPSIGIRLIPSLMDGGDNALIRFSEGGLAVNALDQIFTMTTSHTVSMPSSSAVNPNQVSLRISAATGRFSGSFKLSDINPANTRQSLTRTIGFAGCLIPGEDLGMGYFLLPELPIDGERGSSLRNTPIWSGKVELISAY